MSRGKRDDKDKRTYRKYTRRPASERLSEAYSRAVQNMHICDNAWRFYTHNLRENDSLSLDKL
jgi:hypothetical protein